MQLILASAALIVAVAADTTQQLAAACNPSNPHGIATIVNSCSVSAWVDSTGHPGDGGMMEIKPGKSYCENLVGSPSLKLANNSAANMQTQILQFEYNYDTAQNKIWFDGSNVNCAVQTGSTWDMQNCPFSGFTISGGKRSRRWQLQDGRLPCRQCRAVPGQLPSFQRRQKGHARLPAQQQHQDDPVRRLLRRFAQPCCLVQVDGCGFYPSPGSDQVDVVCLGGHVGGQVVFRGDELGHGCRRQHRQRQWRHDRHAHCHGDGDDGGFAPDQAP